MKIGTDGYYMQLGTDISGDVNKAMDTVEALALSKGFPLPDRKLYRITKHRVDILYNEERKTYATPSV